MKDAFEKLFRAVHQFKKLNVSDLIPRDSAVPNFPLWVRFANGRKRKNYKLRAGGEDQNTSAGCNSTLRGLEEKGYVERSVDKKRPQKYVYQSDREGLKKGKRYGTECRILAAL